MSRPVEGQPADGLQEQGVHSILQDWTAISTTGPRQQQQHSVSQTGERFGRQSIAPRDIHTTAAACGSVVRVEEYEQMARIPGNYGYCLVNRRECTYRPLFAICLHAALLSRLALRS
jgi:hypothetical protein